MNKIILNTLGDKVIVRKAAENGGNAGGDTGGSGGGSEGGWKYYDVSNMAESVLTSIAAYANMAKVKANNKVSIGGTLLIMATSLEDGKCFAVAFNMTAYLYVPGSSPSLMRMDEYFSLVQGGLTFEDMLVQYGAVPITEEGFLNLNI